MKIFSSRSLGGLLLVACCLIGFSACDAFEATGGGPGPAEAGSKLRLAHLLEEQTSGKFGSADSVSLVIGYDPVYESQRVLRTYRVFRRYRVYRRYEFGNLLDGEAITVSAQELQALLDSLETDPSIAWIEPDFPVPVGEISSEFWTEGGQKKSWGVDKSKADDSFYKAGDKQDKNGVPDVDVYVLDSGGEHPDLNIVECVELRGSKFQECRDARDPLGHGTAVAGVIGAKDNEIGLVGTAPGVPLHIVRTLNGAGFSTESRMVKALEFVTARKQANPSRPVVLNLSFGAYVGTTQMTALDEAVQAAINAGIVVVVSAGNDAADASFYSPAHVPDAITVAAHDKSKDYAWFSNYGPVVDLFAPGDRLEVLFAGTEPNKQMFESGTSFAAPHVAGAAAVLLSKNPTWKPKQVRDYLIKLAEKEEAEVDEVPRNTTNLMLYMKELGGKP